MSRRGRSSDISLSEDDRIEPAGPRRKPARKSSRETNEEKPRRGGGRRRGSILLRLTYWCFVAGLWGAILFGGVVAWHAAQLPPIDQLSIPKRPPNIAILDADGVPLANRGGSGGPAVRLDDLPTYLPQAFIAIEDRRFYEHFGLDVVGLARAMVRNLSGGGGLQGGSTLTQQLAKNLFLTQERTVSRKAQEAILALWLERNYSKDRILELYLNRVYFGAGAYGVEAAAQRYFGRSARQVTVQEAAMLAGLMVAPSRLSPTRNPTGAAERAALVINAMAREGFITETMAGLAHAKPAEAIRETSAGSINYAADYVMDVLDETIGAIEDDIVVYTTLRGDLQAAAEKALAGELARRGAQLGVSQGAALAMDPSGQIRAIVGGRNYSESQYNRAVSAKRQPGSSFKPFVYLAALEKGLTPDTIREDAPINVRGWRPENASREYQGSITLQRALSQSSNTVAVRLGLEVGPKAVVEAAHRLGVHSSLTPDASIALGTSDVTLLEMVSAYATFANGGIRIQPHVITQVKAANGAVLYRRKGASFGRVIDARHVSMMNAMLRETLHTGTAARADIKDIDAAGKTGTSQEHRDGWFVGYSSQLVAGVWFGNDDASPTKRVSGANIPAAVWAEIMRDHHKGVRAAPLPSNWREGAPGRPAGAVGDRQEPVSVSSVASPTPPTPGGSSRGAAQAGLRDTRMQTDQRRDSDLLPPAELGAQSRPTEIGGGGLFDRLFR